MCVREASFTEASELCQEMGARLCNVEELERREGNPSSCGYDSILAWTWVDGGQPDMCPNNQSLGVAGRPGAWYSFSAVAAGAYHEIQLRGADDKSSYSLNTDIIDSDGEVAHAAVPPTLHRRADGVMLRWNITQGGGPYFVRVTSANLDAEYSMVAIVPPIYQCVGTNGPEEVAAR
jgi:hypothetical protein